MKILLYFNFPFWKTTIPYDSFRKQVTWVKLKLITKNLIPDIAQFCKQSGEYKKVLIPKRIICESIHHFLSLYKMSKFCRSNFGALLIFRCPLFPFGASLFSSAPPYFFQRPKRRFRLLMPKTGTAYHVNYKRNIPNFTSKGNNNVVFCSSSIKILRVNLL